jgi:CheY-like chemotaxis protein
MGENIKIEMNFADEKLMALADLHQLESAILNLAINARDAMSGGGMLSIEVSEVELDDDYATAYNEVFPGRYVMILISDTGIGMSQEVRKRAFEPFFTTKPQGSGTGLGLSSVYGFVKQSGGHITLYSEPSQGTTIRIYLPCSSDSSGSFVQTPTDAATYPKGHGELVLVVEDDDRVRRVTVARLKTLAYKVIESVNGPTALAILEENPNVDLLFTDMVMPGGMTGAELAAQAQVKWPRMKILFTSGYAEPEVIRQADSKSGDWLRKPYAASELAHKLRTIFGEKHGK